MLSTWAAQPKGPPATIPAPFTRLEKAIWNWWAKNAPEDMPDTVMSGRIELGKGSERLDRNILVVRDAHQGQVAQTSTVQTAAALLEKRTPVTASLLRACSQQMHS